MKPDIVSFKVEYGKNLAVIGKNHQFIHFDRESQKFRFMDFTGTKKELLELLDNAKSIVAKMDKCYETELKA